MAETKNIGKKGFSGLSGLVSDVEFSDESQKQADTLKASSSQRASQPPQKVVPPRPQEQRGNSIRSVEKGPSDNSGSSSAGKWILGLIGVCFVLWIIVNTGKNSTQLPRSAPKTPSYAAQQSNSDPVALAPSEVPQSAELQNIKPNVGTNNVLSVSEIRWCITEQIRLDAMRKLMDTNAEVDAFNRLVSDYNSRCGSYRYRAGAQAEAMDSVEPYRSQIVADVVRKFEQLKRSYPPSSSSSAASSARSTFARPVENSHPEKPSALHTREAQQLLNDLGYNPGPVDAGYDRRTADAVKAFQRDVGIAQDGRIDEAILTALRKAKARYIKR